MSSTQQYFVAVGWFYFSYHLQSKENQREIEHIKLYMNPNLLQNFSSVLVRKLMGIEKIAIFCLQKN